MPTPLPHTPHPFDDATLLVLLDVRESQVEFERVVAALIDQGVGAIQLRDKRADDRTLLGRARVLVDRCRETPTRSIINDRVDIAMLAEADAVHVGQEELPVSDVRRLVSERIRIGVSTHSLPQLREAIEAKADYLGVGPVFPSATKTFSMFPGLDYVQQVAAADVCLPWYAIGGITLDNVERVLAAGARRIAVRGAILDAPDIRGAAAAMLRRLAGAGHSAETR